jgi:hypothetical protein
VKITYLDFRLKAKKKIMHRGDFKPKNDLKPPPTGRGRMELKEKRK